MCERRNSAFVFTSSCLILSSSSHSRPSSTSIALFITDAISLILSMCACISCKGKIRMNTIFHFPTQQMQEVIVLPWCAAPWAGSRWRGRPVCWPWGAWKPAPCIWSWWALTQIGVPPMTSWALQLDRKIRTKVPLVNRRQAPTFVFMLELSDLTVLLLDPQNQTRARTMSRNLVQTVDLFLILPVDDDHISVNRSSAWTGF